MCFVCHRHLDGWEEGDDPVAEHLKHAPECGWAINASIAETFKNGGQVTDDPMSEQLAQARADTFGEFWPYEGKKGWKCKVGKMVAAGWCYDPSPEYDDGVTCSYCSLSLDGWERNDDPLYVFILANFESDLTREIAWNTSDVLQTVSSLNWLKNGPQPEPK
jgi:hypothetical protein